MANDYGVPDDTLYYQRVEASNTLSDRCVVLGLTYYPDSNLWNPPTRVLLSGLPASALPAGFSGSGIPVSIRDLNNNPFRTQNFAILAQSLNVGIQEFRHITLPWFFIPAINALSGLRRDFQIVVGGSLSGSSWLGGTSYSVLQFADDSSEAITSVVFARKKGLR